MKKSILLIAILFSFCLTAQTSETFPFVKVSGISKIKVIPDYVLIDVKIEENDKNATTAKQKHDVGVNNVLSFLKKSKIDKKNIHTQYLSLNKQWDYNLKEYKYTANQTISIRLDDLTKYEKIIQGLFEAGVNGINGIRFSTSNYEELVNETRVLAVKQAKQKAELYAKELNQTVGKAIIISEFNTQETPIYRNTTENEDIAFVMVKNMPNETIAIGEMVITGTIYITFELK